MNDVICPLDRKPCDPYCRYRYKDQPGGCYLTTAEELGFQTLVIVEAEETSKAAAFKEIHDTQSGMVKS